MRPETKAGLLGGLISLSLALLLAADWPSTSGTTAKGMVIEDGVGGNTYSGGGLKVNCVTGCATVSINQATPGTTNLVSDTFAQQVTSDPTVQNASYVSGNCIGGFNAVTVAVNNGQTGFITNFRVVSAGGSTPAITVFLFDSNPSASTCTDKSTFTLNSADIDKLISNPNGSAFTLTAPTGTTVSMGSVDFLPPKPFIAGGTMGSGVKTIYYALVSGSTFTPAATTDIHTRIGVVLN